MLQAVTPKPKPGKVKKSPRKALERKLDAICKTIVLFRDGHCVTEPPVDGHTKVMQAGHLISRTRESVRWDLRNIHVQCSGCNLRHEYYSHYFTGWYVGKFGAEGYECLTKDANEIRKLQLYELEELLEQLNKIAARHAEAIARGEEYKPYFTQKEIMSGAWANK